MSPRFAIEKIFHVNPIHGLSAGAAEIAADRRDPAQIAEADRADPGGVRLAQQFRFEPAAQAGRKQQTGGNLEQFVRWHQRLIAFTPISRS